MIPPILEIYVVWHPDDRAGSRIAREFVDHFHGTAYSGLVGGAVDVYVRSEGWLGRREAPRPLPFMTQLPNGLPPASVTAVIPVLGTRLARAVAQKGSWNDWLREMVEKAKGQDLIGVFPVRLDAEATDDSVLGDIFPVQYLAPTTPTGHDAYDADTRCRDLSQSIAQLIGDPLGDRLNVFVSHTKRHSPDEEPDRVDELVENVRYCISRTHLREFFDEHDIQPGSDGAKEMGAQAASSALLIVRTDRYASREWCQREVLTAKRAQMPIVTLHALHGGEDRGSFIMDHVPSVAVHTTKVRKQRLAIEVALNKLVDEALKRALWGQQASHLAQIGFDWTPPHAPEPVTLIPWLQGQQGASPNRILVIHPDPPLGPDENLVIEEICAIAGLPGLVDVLTPRTFASRGGQIV